MQIINQKYNDLTSYSVQFFNNKPFPYLILDSFLEEKFYDELNNESSKINNNKGKSFTNEVEKNKWISKNTQLPNKVREIITELNSRSWIDNLKKLTNIDTLFGTEVGNTDLANYHEMSRSGFLGSHVDHSADPNTGKPHVLNIILYLTKNWKTNWGGSTTLSDKKGKKIIKEIEYIPNRAVIFLHTPYSFHGVSKLQNNNINRATIYVDYYSQSKQPFENINPNFNNKWFKHGTCFVLENKLDYFKLKNLYYTKTLINYKIREFFS